jgi:hypothetical protein
MDYAARANCAENAGLKCLVHLVICMLATLVLPVVSVPAQELTPRAYWPAPKGTKVAVFGYIYTFGDIVTDPTLPVVGVDSQLNSAAFGYLQTFSLAGRTANFVVELPYAWGHVDGTVQGQDVTRELAGVGDIGATLSVNFMGAPSMNPLEFRQLLENPRQVLGASVKVVAPIGDYEEEKLLNIGTNRWSGKAEVGYIIPLHPRWFLELEAGAWFFEDNDEFVGVTREQDPIFAGDIHIVWSIRPGFWTSLDLNYFAGGRTTVDGTLNADLQRNSRIGVDVFYAIKPSHSIKFGYTRGVVTESGGDYSSVLLAYQVQLGRPAGPD